MGSEQHSVARSVTFGASSLTSVGTYVHAWLLGRTGPWACHTVTLPDLNPRAGYAVLTIIILCIMCGLCNKGVHARCMRQLLLTVSSYATYACVAPATHAYMLLVSTKWTPCKHALQLYHLIMPWHGSGRWARWDTCMRKMCPRARTCHALQRLFM